MAGGIVPNVEEKKSRPVLPCNRGRGSNSKKHAALKLSGKPAGQGAQEGASDQIQNGVNGEEGKKQDYEVG